MIRLATATLFCATLLAPASAFAQQGSFAARQAARQACHADYQKFCAGTQPGGGRVLACFQQHRADLSADCLNALQALKTSG